MISYRQYETLIYRLTAKNKGSNTFIYDKHINIYTGRNKTHKDGFYQNG